LIEFWVCCAVAGESLFPKKFLVNHTFVATVKWQKGMNSMYFVYITVITFELVVVGVYRFCSGCKGFFSSQSSGRWVAPLLATIARSLTSSFVQSSSAAFPSTPSQKVVKYQRYFCCCGTVIIVMLFILIILK